MIELSSDQSYKDAYMQRRERLGMAARPVQRVSPDQPSIAPLVIAAPPPPPAITISDMEPSPDEEVQDEESTIWRINRRWTQIVREVCQAHKVSRTEIMSHRRTPRIAISRHEAFWKLREFTCLSLPQIGRLMGGFDHSSILYGCRKHESRMMEKPVSLDEFMDRQVGFEA